MSTLESKLAAGLAAMNLQLPAESQQKLLAYIGLLQKWNSTYNLTALRDPLRMVSHHLLDSLTLLPYLYGAASLIDVGSGGGMPGDLAVTLLDANTKKTAFLQQAVIELGLDNVTVSACRVEKLTDRQADVVTSRAFAELGDFVSLSRHLLKDGGRWAAMKGVYPYEELETLPEDVEVCQIDKLTVPELDAERHMVLLRPKGN